MMKKIITPLSALALCLGSLAWAQTGRVGINTTTPGATIDITPKNTDGSTPEGTKVPQLTGDAMQKMTTTLTAEQNGMIVFVTAPVSTTDANTLNMTYPGHYRFSYDASTNPATTTWVRMEPSGLEKNATSIGTSESYNINPSSSYYGWKLISNSVEDGNSQIGEFAVDMSVKNHLQGAAGNYAAAGNLVEIDESGSLTTKFNPVSGYDYLNFFGFNKALGKLQGASGAYSFTAGYDAHATGAASVAFGTGCIAGNTGTFAMGNLAIATGMESFAFGPHLHSHNLMEKQYSTVIPVIIRILDLLFQTTAE